MLIVVIVEDVATAVTPAPAKFNVVVEELNKFPSSRVSILAGGIHDAGSAPPAHVTELTVNALVTSTLEKTMEAGMQDSANGPFEQE